MSDLISKEALINEIVNTQAILEGYNSAYQSYNSAYFSGGAERQFEILDIIKKLPTVSEQEIRNKAIKEFSEKMKETTYQWFKTGTIAVGMIDEIAVQQMKGETT